MTPPVVLSIAATDSGGGAGIAADLTTFAALGVHGTCVITAVTAQDTTGVHATAALPTGFVAAQLDAVLRDLRPAVVKTGVLATVPTVRLIAERCAGLQIVVDPVISASSGAVFADAEVIAAYRDHLLPIATVITPNAEEDAVLGRDHGRPVVRTGSEHGLDVLCLPGQEPVTLAHPRVLTRNDHGTGCTYASALAAHLARGLELSAAAVRAADFVAGQLRRSADWRLGSGRGPIAHTIARTEGESA